MKAVAAVLMLAACTAQAAVIAEAIDEPVRVELHDQTGYCQNGALLALWIEGNARLTGCWRIVGSSVQIAWSDADVSRAPIAVFKPIKGS